MKRTTIKILLYALLLLGAIDINICALMAIASMKFGIFAGVMLAGFIGTISAVLGIEKIYGKEE